MLRQILGVALRRQVPGLVRNISEKKRLQWRDYAAQFATHALADGDGMRCAAFAERSVNGALRQAGASPATWSPARALLRERKERAEVAERQAAQEHLQQTLAAVSSAASKADNGADEARLILVWPCLADPGPYI